MPQWYRSGARLVPQRCYSNARPMADLVESPRVDEAVVGQPDHVAVVPGHQIRVAVWHSRGCFFSSSQTIFKKFKIRNFS